MAKMLTFKWSRGKNCEMKEILFQKEMKEEFRSRLFFFYRSRLYIWLDVSPAVTNASLSAFRPCLHHSWRFPLHMKSKQLNAPASPPAQLASRLQHQHQHRSVAVLACNQTWSLRPSLSKSSAAVRWMLRLQWTWGIPSTTHLQNHPWSLTPRRRCSPPLFIPL